MKEYRVVSQRRGIDKRKVTRYVHLGSALKRVKLMTTKEPWKLFGEKADENHCCSGHMCGCGGMTVREYYEDHYKSLPPLEYVHIEERDVGEWRFNPANQDRPE